MAAPDASARGADDDDFSSRAGPRLMPRLFGSDCRAAILLLLMGDGDGPPPREEAHEASNGCISARRRRH